MIAPLASSAEAGTGRPRERKATQCGTCFTVITCYIILSVSVCNLQRSLTLEVPNTMLEDRDL